MADSYCLLDVYSALSSNPDDFGLQPADLRSAASSRSEKSGDKKQRAKEAEQMKKPLSREVRVRTQFRASPLIDVHF